MAIRSRQLTETAVTLIVQYLRTNINAALQAIALIHPDDLVTLEPPPSSSYFPFEKAHGYQCPAIFVVDDGMDFRQAEKGANYIDALLAVNVTVKVEDSDMTLLTMKAWRYQAALQSLLDQTPLASLDGKVKLYSKVKGIKPSGTYTYGNSEEDETATFFKEYTLNLAIDFFENF